MILDQQQKIVSIARSLIGRPYKYGAKPEEAPDFFDCSSFTQYCMKQIGIDIPRSSILQAEDARGMVVNNQKDLSNLELGDLLFFRGARGYYSPTFPQGIGHVALYIGGGAAVHAGSRRASDYPSVTETGSVEERKLTELVAALAPIVVIKRF